MVERQAGKPDEALGHLTAACDLLATHAPDMLADAREAKALTLQDLGQLVTRKTSSARCSPAARKLRPARNSPPPSTTSP